MSGFEKSDGSLNATCIGIFISFYLFAEITKENVWFSLFMYWFFIIQQTHVNKFLGWEDFLSWIIDDYETRLNQGIVSRIITVDV